MGKIANLITTDPVTPTKLEAVFKNIESAVDSGRVVDEDNFDIASVSAPDDTNLVDLVQDVVDCPSNSKFFEGRIIDLHDTKCYGDGLSSLTRWDVDFDGASVLYYSREISGSNTLIKLYSDIGVTLIVTATVPTSSLPALGYFTSGTVNGTVYVSTGFIVTAHSYNRIVPNTQPKQLLHNYSEIAGLLNRTSHIVRDYTVQVSWTDTEVNGILEENAQMESDKVQYRDSGRFGKFIGSAFTFWAVGLIDIAQKKKKLKEARNDARSKTRTTFTKSITIDLPNGYELDRWDVSGVVQNTLDYNDTIKANGAVINFEVGYNGENSLVINVYVTFQDGSKLEDGEFVRVDGKLNVLLERRL